MSLVDYERAWLHLKQRIAEKRSHGQKDLAVAMSEIEIECMIDPQTTPTETDRLQLSESGMSDDPNPLLVEEARNGNSNEQHQHQREPRRHPVRG